MNDRNAKTFESRINHESSGVFTGFLPNGERNCPQCKYPLEGLPSTHACPECGFQYDSNTNVWEFGKRLSLKFYLGCLVVGSTAMLLSMSILSGQMMGFALVAFFFLMLFGEVVLSVVDVVVTRVRRIRVGTGPAGVFHGVAGQSIQIVPWSEIRSVNVRHSILQGPHYIAGLRLKDYSTVDVLLPTNREQAHAFERAAMSRVSPS